MTLRWSIVALAAVLTVLPGRSKADDLQQDSFAQVQQLAQAGHVDAERELGIRYAKGQDTERNYDTALKWTRKAADAGDAWAVRNLGISYLNGFGVEKDTDRPLPISRRPRNLAKERPSTISVSCSTKARSSSATMMPRIRGICERRTKDIPWRSATSR